MTIIIKLSAKENIENIFICKCILTKLTKVTNLLRGLKNWHNKLHKCPCKHKDLFYYFVRFYKFMYLLLFLVLASYRSTQHCIRLTEKHSNYIYEFHNCNKLIMIFCSMSVNWDFIDSGWFKTQNYMHV